MGIESGNYITNLDSSNPLSSDNVSEGDDHLRLLKNVLKKTFPAGTNDVGPDQAVQVIISKATAPTISGSAAQSTGLMWLDTTANLLKIRNQANDAWITLAVDPETSNSVDVNAGTIDGTTIGATSASTGVFSSVNIAADGATVTGIKDEDDMSSNSAVKLATQQSIKAYVDTQLTAEDLDISTDTGGPIAIDLDSETLAISGGEGIDTSSTGNAVTIAAEEATSSNKGVASFSTDNFLVSSGAVTIKDAGIVNAELADMAANTIKVRDANSSGVPSDKALASGELIIGDGTGFTAAGLSSDVSMTNAGAVTVTKIQGKSVTATAPTNDQYMKYSTPSAEWQMVSVVGDDKLTTKGDLLVYNTVDSETRLGIGTNDYVLTADSSATNGLAWAAASVADGAITNAKMADMAAGTVKVRDAGTTGVPSDVALTTTQILIGDGSGVTAAALSGDVTMTNAGVVSLGTGVIVDADVNASAAIDATKIADGTVTSTEFQYINTLSSNAQTQINAKGVGDAVLSADQSWSGSQRGTPSVVTDGTLDLDTANNFKYTPAAADVLEFTNETSGQSGFITVINPSAYAISLGSEVKKGASWDVSTAGTYLVTYYSDGTSVYVSASEALS